MTDRGVTDSGATERKATDGKGAVRYLLPGLLAVAAVIRAVFLVQLSGSDVGSLLPLDMRFYHDLAASLASGGGLPAGGLTFNPLYPVFLVPMFKVFGDGLLAPRIVQALAGLVTIWMMKCKLSTVLKGRILQAVMTIVTIVRMNQKMNQKRIQTISVKEFGKKESI